MASGIVRCAINAVLEDRRVDQKEQLYNKYNGVYYSRGKTNKQKPGLKCKPSRNCVILNNC